MKSFFTLLLLTFVFSFSFAQTPNWIWAETGTVPTSNEYCSGLVIDTSDNIYVYGRAIGSMTLGGQTVNGGNYSGKLDSSGNAIWLQTYSYLGYDYPFGLCRDNNNNTYNTGSGGSGSEVYIDKYNSAGTLVWHPVATGGNCSGYGVAADNFGHVYATGDYSSPIPFGSTTLPYGGSNHAGYLTKLDSNGNFLWATCFYGLGANDGYNVGRSVATDNAGNVYMCGGYMGTPTFYSANNGPSITAAAATGYSNFFVAKYDSSGNVLNVIVVPSAGIDNGDYGYRNNIAIDSCGNIYATGFFQNTATFGSINVTSQGGNDFFVAKYNSSAGQWEWVKTGAGSGNESASGITLDKNSDVYVSGHAGSSPATIGPFTLGTPGSFVAKFSNSTGDVQWAQSAATNTQGAGSVAVDKQKYVFVGGSYSGTATVGSTTLDAGGSVSIALYVAKLDTVPARVITPKVLPSYCPGSTTELPFKIIGIFNSGNVFTAQLSNDSGSFVSPVSLGTVTSTTNDSISITIPANTPIGSNYLIRVTSSSPATSSYANGCSAYFSNNVYTNDFYVSIGGGNATATVSNDTSICSGTSAQLHVSGANTYSWSPGSSLNDSTSANPIATPSASQTYTVTATGGCGTVTKTVAVNVTQSATISVIPADTTVCSGNLVKLNATGAASYLWSPGAELSDSTIASPTVFTDSSVTYHVTSGSGVCSNTFTVTITVGNTAIGGTVTAARDTICEGTPGSLTLINNSSNTIQWQSSTDSINFISLSGDTLVKYKTSPLSQSTWYRALVGSGSCSAISDTLKLFVPQPLIAYFNVTQTSANTLSFNSDSSSGNIRSYHWDFGDNSISTEASPSHTFAEDTTYYVCLTLYDGSNCSYTFCRYSSVTDAVPTVSAAGNWAIYPNPFTNQLYIRTDNGSNKAKSIQLFNVLGEMVMNQNVGNSWSGLFQLDVSNLAEGMYFVKIATESNNYVQKIIKVKQ